MRRGQSWESKKENSEDEVRILMETVGRVTENKENETMQGVKENEIKMTLKGVNTRGI